MAHNWRCRLCGKSFKSMGRRRLHEHTCTKRPEITQKEWK